MRKSRSGSTSCAVQVASALAVLCVAAWPPTAPAQIRVEPIAVDFKIKDWRLRQTTLADPDDLKEVADAARDELARALVDRFAHLDFQTREGAANRLECVMDTAARDANGGPSLVEPRAATRLYFTLTCPKLGAPLHWEVQFQSWLGSWRPDPVKSDFQRQIAAFIRGAPGDDATAKKVTDDRWASLYATALAKLPLFDGRRIEHVAATRVVTINVPRADYVETLPDESEFFLKLRILSGGGVLEQEHGFRARVLNASLVEPLAPSLGERAKAIVAEIVRCDSDTVCSQAIIDDLVNGAPRGLALPLLLVGPVPPKPREVSPERFDPSGP